MDHTGITATPIARSGSVHEGDTIMITCCTSEPVDGYEWSRLDGLEMPSKAVGVNSSTLFIPSASVDDVGLYSCSGFQANQTNQWDPVQSDPVQIWIAGGQYGKTSHIMYCIAYILNGQGNLDCTLECRFVYVDMESYIQHSCITIPTDLLATVLQVLVSHLLC